MWFAGRTDTVFYNGLSSTEFVSQFGRNAVKTVQEGWHVPSWPIGVITEHIRVVDKRRLPDRAILRAWEAVDRASEHSYQNIRIRIRRGPLRGSPSRSCSAWPRSFAQFWPFMSYKRTHVSLWVKSALLSQNVRISSKRSLYHSDRASRTEQVECPPALQPATNLDA